MEGEFREFVAAQQASLFRTAWLLTGDRQAAEDLVQTALMKVWPRWDAVVRRGEPTAYVRTTLTRTYLSWRRRKWYGEVPAHVVPDRPVSGDEYADADLRDALAAVLPTLAPRQRAVVVLRYYHDLTEAETARVLDCSVGTVKSQCAKALATLRTRYADLEPAQIDKRADER